MEDLRYISCQILNNQKSGETRQQPENVKERLIAGADIEESESECSDVDLCSHQSNDFCIDDELETDVKSSWKPEEFIETDLGIFNFPACLSQDCAVEYLGVVFAIVDNQIVTQSTVIHSPLNRGSLLCTVDRQVIGKVSETFGPVSNPFYITPISTSQPIVIEIGCKVFYCPLMSSFVATSELRNQKGCDASNQLDQEISENEMEYSDDEDERARKCQRRKRNLSTVSGDKDVNTVERNEKYSELKERALDDVQRNVSLFY